MKPYIIGILAWVGVFGACVGSFVNVVAYRLSREESFVRGRSHCPSCDTALRWYDLLPLVSFVLLRGRCRYCGGRVSWRYPAAELVCAAAAVLCVLRFELSWLTPLSFAVCAILLAVTLCDIETMEIPNGLTLALVPVAVAFAFFDGGVPLVSRGIGLVAVSIPLLLMALVISGAFGGGDIKLMAVCGFLLGWQNTLLAFFIAVLLGGSYSVYLMASGKRKKGAHIAFGPYLCIGVAAAMLYGNEIIRFYLGLYGL